MSVIVQDNTEIINVIINEEGDLKVIINETNEVSNIIISELGSQGIPGKSAYIIAVENGFQGTENQYVLLSTGQIEKISGEPIPSYTPIALINDIAYKLDSSNQNHTNSFYGFSLNGTSISQSCLIQTRGDIEFIGWGLTPNTQYLAGPSGSLITDNINQNQFTKIIGHSLTPNKLQIIKEYTTINKI